jgi:pyrimidine operon attenuation protein/uracil phosphoribosyltransferase
MNAISSRVLLLNNGQIERKLLRMAWQIWEHNSNRRSVTLVGIKNSGAALAERLAAELRRISPLQINVVSLELAKRQPLHAPVTLDAEIGDKSVVLVDDVANSGRTLLHALQPIAATDPEKVLIAVLVDRKHKSFPVNPDIIGLQVATTLQENILVSIEPGGMEAWLE